MRSNLQRMAASLERAKAIGLAKTIERLASDREEPRRQRSEIERRRRTIINRYDDPLAANRQLERILKGNELADITYLRRGLIAARSICRVVVKTNGRLSGYGTGFLVAPGVVVTNQHVLRNAAEVAGSTVEFGYERDLSGIAHTDAEFALAVDPAPIIFNDLDFALARVAPIASNGRSLEEYGWLKLSPQPGKAFIGEYLTIIQHPGGEPKQVCVRENKLLQYDEDGPYLWYQTDTAGGSSGSPVFNNDWEVVGLHHSAVPRTKTLNGKQVWLMQNGEPWTSDMSDDRIDWIANEGIRVSRIVTYLRDVHASHPLARAVLGAGEAPVHESSSRRDGRREAIETEWSNDGLLRVRVPVELGIRVGIGGLTNGANAIPAVTVASTSVAGSPAARVVEKVIINQNNYAERDGYRPKFLGGGHTVALPLPTKKTDALQIGKSLELKYWNYSVVFHKTRRLALVSAANVDPSEWKGNRDADGDTWYDDTRVSAELQVGRSFYKKQAKFEADRTLSPFDQGHLTRRSDVQWGDDDATAKRNGDDSYHYTNCAPQHWRFNQNNKASGIWFRLEEHAAAASDGKRLCLFNGPIFDAPPSKVGSDGRLHLNPKGKREKDREFGGVLIPKQFFKVIVYASGGELRSAAFIVSQEDLLPSVGKRLRRDESVKKAPLSEDEVRLYQVPVATVAALTGLWFGNLGSGAEEALIVEDDAWIEELGDVRF